MQIRHKNGHVLLCVHADCLTSSGSDNVYESGIVTLTESEASYLLDGEGRDLLRQYVSEARAFNQKDKLDEIAKLKIRLKELESSLHPISEQPRKKI